MGMTHTMTSITSRWDSFLGPVVVHICNAPHSVSGSPRASLPLFTPLVGCRRARRCTKRDVFFLQAGGPTLLQEFAWQLQRVRHAACCDFHQTDFGLAAMHVPGPAPLAAHTMVLLRTCWMNTFDALVDGCCFHPCSRAARHRLLECTTARRRALRRLLVATTPAHSRWGTA